MNCENWAADVAAIVIIISGWCYSLHLNFPNTATAFLVSI